LPIMNLFIELFQQLLVLFNKKIEPYKFSYV